MVYTFATPEGVLANADLMFREIGIHNKFLSIEIINIRGEKKTIGINNINELNEPALSQWLYPSSSNNL